METAGWRAAVAVLYPRGPGHLVTTGLLQGCMLTRLLHNAMHYQHTKLTYGPYVNIVSNPAS